MALTLDGSALSADNNAVSANSATLTTSLTDDILICVIHQSDTTNNRTVTSVTDSSGLTWTNRLSSHVQNVLGTTSWNNIEVWWALAATAGTRTITCTISGASDHLVLNVWGINGANTSAPFDSNAGLPYIGNNLTNVNANPTIIGGVSTTGVDDFVFAIYAANENFVPPTSLAARLEGGVGGSPGGYTALSDFSPGSGTLWERLSSAYKVVSGALSASLHTISLNSNHTRFIVDAVTADAGGVTGTSDMTFATMTQALVGTVAVPVGGTIEQTFPTMIIEGAAQEVFTGTSAMTFTTMTQALTGAEVFSGTSDMVFDNRIISKAFGNQLQAAGNPNYYSWWFLGP